MEIDDFFDTANYNPLAYDPNYPAYTRAIVALREVGDHDLDYYRKNLSLEQLHYLLKAASSIPKQLIDSQLEKIISNLRRLDDEVKKEFAKKI